MAKTDYNAALKNIGSKLTNSERKTPIQEVSPIDIKTHSGRPKLNEPGLAETKFTVHIPTPLMDVIKSIAFNRKKKIKTIFVEALAEFASKNQ